jgi:hypothetical protein
MPIAFSELFLYPFFPHSVANLEIVNKSPSLASSAAQCKFNYGIANIEFLNQYTPFRFTFCKEMFSHVSIEFSIGIKLSKRYWESNQETILTLTTYHNNVTRPSRSHIYFHCEVVFRILIINCSQLARNTRLKKKSEELHSPLRVRTYIYVYKYYYLYIFLKMIKW